MDLQEVKQQSMEIRKKYHALERQIHQQEWTTEEDALAFLTDAGLVGRHIMAKEGRWPSDDQAILPAKIGECVWWLAVLSERSGIDFSDAVEDFLKTRLEYLSKD
ncbi:MazG-like protein [uncultured Megasphaera sp.]|uniref:MazG-like protein n=1 Tax=Megasphaera massiliensis TaxID=1232428 RepID=UPI00266CDF92|nr:MazG-like protein [uncultured Megasphaera sp.]